MINFKEEVMLFLGKSLNENKNRPAKDFGSTPEEREMMLDVIKSKKKKNKPAEDFGSTPEEKEMMLDVIKSKKKKNKPTEDFGSTPEEREMMLDKLKKKSIATKTPGDDGEWYNASCNTCGSKEKKSIVCAHNNKRSKMLERDVKPLPDDHTNGRNSSSKTTFKESLARFCEGVCGISKTDDSAIAYINQIKNKVISKELREEVLRGNSEAVEMFHLISEAEDEYINGVPGAKLKYDKLIAKAFAN